MRLCKKGVGESRADCSRLMVLDRRRRVDQKTSGQQTENEGVEYRQTSGVCSIQLDETREVGRGMVV